MGCGVSFQDIKEMQTNGPKKAQEAKVDGAELAKFSAAFEELQGKVNLGTAAEDLDEKQRSAEIKRLQGLRKDIMDKVAAFCNFLASSGLVFNPKNNQWTDRNGKRTWSDVNVVDAAARGLLEGISIELFRKKIASYDKWITDAQTALGTGAERETDRKMALNYATASRRQVDLLKEISESERASSGLLSSLKPLCAWADKEYTFNGTQQLCAPNDPKHRLTDAFSLVVWVRPERAVSDWVRVLGKGSSGTRNYGLWIHSTARQTLTQTYGVSSGHIQSRHAELNKWTHMATTFKKNGYMRFYLDGKCVGNNKTGGSPHTDGQPITLGGANFHSKLRGKIRGAAVFSRELLESEIRMIFDAGIFDANPESLIGVRRPLNKEFDAKMDGLRVEAKRLIEKTEKLKDILLVQEIAKFKSNFDALRMEAKLGENLVAGKDKKTQGRLNGLIKRVKEEMKALGQYLVSLGLQSQGNGQWRDGRLRAVPIAQKAMALASQLVEDLRCKILKLVTQGIVKYLGDARAISTTARDAVAGDNATKDQLIAACDQIEAISEELNAKMNEFGTTLKSNGYFKSPLVDPLFAWADKEYTFNGTQQLCAPNDPKHRLTDAFSLVVWVRPERAVSDWVRVLGKGSSGTRNYGLWIHSTARQTLTQTYGVSSGHIQSRHAELNKWTHMATTFKKNGYMRFYLDGKCVGNNKTGGSPHTDGQPITLGGANFHSKLRGKIRGAAVFSRELSAKEIASIVDFGPDMYKEGRDKKAEAKISKVFEQCTAFSAVLAKDLFFLKSRKIAFSLGDVQTKIGPLSSVKIDHLMKTEEGLERILDQSSRQLTEAFKLSGEVDDFFKSFGFGIRAGDKDTVHSWADREYSFNGSQQLRAPADPAHKLTDTYTLMLWLYPTRAIGDWVRVLGKGASGPRNYGLWIHGTSKRTLSQTHGISGGNVGGPHAPLNKWTHMATTFKKNGLMCLYIDGKLVGKQTTSGVPSTDGQPITLGGANFHSKFTGRIRRAFVSSRQYSATEIGDIFRHGPGGDSKKAKDGTKTHGLQHAAVKKTMQDIRARRDALLLSAHLYNVAALISRNMRSLIRLRKDLRKRKLWRLSDTKTEAKSTMQRVCADLRDVNKMEKEFLKAFKPLGVIKAPSNQENDDKTVFNSALELESAATIVPYSILCGVEDFLELLTKLKRMLTFAQIEFAADYIKRVLAPSDATTMDAKTKVDTNSDTVFGSTPILKRAYSGLVQLFGGAPNAAKESSVAKHSYESTRAFREFTDSSNKVKSILTEFPDLKDILGTSLVVSGGMQAGALASWADKEIKFNGGQQLRAPSNPKHRLTEAFTLMAWIYPTRAIGDWVRVLGKGASGPRNYGLWIHGTARKTLSQTYGIRNGNLSGPQAPLNKWTHMATTFRRNGQFTLYINGKCVVQKTTGGVPSTDGQPVTLGGADFHSKFVGNIRGAAVYGREFSGKEISDIFESGPSIGFGAKIRDKRRQVIARNSKFPCSVMSLVHSIGEPIAKAVRIALESYCEKSYPHLKVEVEEVTAAVTSGRVVNQTQGGSLALSMPLLRARHKYIRKNGADWSESKGQGRTDGKHDTKSMIKCVNSIREKLVPFQSLGINKKDLREGAANMRASLAKAQETVAAKISGAFMKLLPGDDSKVREHWSKRHPTLPEYIKAASMISLESEWMCNTMLVRHIQDASDRYKSVLADIKKNVAGTYSAQLTKAIRKGYKLGSDSAARSQRDVLNGQSVYGLCQRVFGSLEAWKKPYMALSMKLVVDLETDSNAIVTKLSEVCDRATKCRNVQVTGFNVMSNHSSRLVHGLHADKKCGKSRDLTDYDTALSHFYECMEDYIDDHTANAFKSAFLEPSRFYFSAANSYRGQGWLKDNVETHAQNYYLAMLNSTLSVHLPYMPAYFEGWVECNVDFWAGLNADAWKVFSDPKNFGKQFEGIKELKRSPAKYVSNHNVPRRTFPKGRGLPNAKTFANQAVDPRQNTDFRKQLSLYLERFTLFFERDFFVTKAFNKLNAQTKPEHAGFRKACETLFGVFRDAQGVEEDDFIEYSFKDELYTQIDIVKIARFFVWLGVLRPDTETKLPPDGVRKRPEKKIREEKSTVPPPAEMPKLVRSKSMEEQLVDELQAKIQTAMRNRDTGAIRKLMAERREAVQRLHAMNGQTSV